MNAPSVEHRGRLFRKYVVLFVALVSGALFASGALEIYFSYQENKVALVTPAAREGDGRGRRASSSSCARSSTRSAGRPQPQLVAPRPPSSSAASTTSDSCARCRRSPR